MTETEAYAAFLRWRWPETNGRPVCPECSSQKVYVGKTGRRLFHCANGECRRQFTATASTIFARRKMAFASILVALDIAGECSALELKRRLGCGYKVAYVTAQKIASGNPRRWVGYWQRGYAQRIEARSDETLAAQPERREPGPKDAANL